MTEPILCPQCGSEIPSGSPAGLCPKCLVLAGLESQPPAAGPPPTQTSPVAGSTGFVPPAIEELAAQFPQLEILDLIGRGGMGAVYKARQPGLDRLVALKILPKEISGDAAFAERFTREARALARLSHPNIVAVYDFGPTLPSPAGRTRQDGRGAGSEGSALPSPSGRGAGGEGPLFYFIMEYVDGVNLRQAIQSGSMSPSEALAIVPQICDALQFAHDEGIVHRDIKPENILVDKRGRVKIADFGLAKLLGQTPGDVALTTTQQVMGTLRYMAPEQMEGNKAVDHRADIYSLGVVFYELLTGELPIGRFAPPSKKVEIDVRLDEVVLRALEKEPEQRYQHASDVKTEVELIRSTTRQSAPPPAPPAASVDEIPPDRCSPWRRVRLLATLTVWTAALVGGWGYFFPLIWSEWWPWAYHEQWETSATPQSGAYKEVRLRAERRMYCWGQHADRLIFKQPWIGTATIDVPGQEAAVTLEMDSFHDEWRWTLRDGTATHSPQEPSPEFVVQQMKAAGIDISKPGIQEEAAALIGLVKDAAKGVLLGVPARGPLPTGGTKIGPFIASGSWGGGGAFPEGAVGPVDTHLLAGVLLLAIWSPGILIVVRRHRQRLAAAHETEQRYRLGTIGFWIAILCFLAAVTTLTFPWVRLSSSMFSTSSSMFSTGLMAFSAWYGTVSVLAFLVVLLLCFLTDFFAARRSWQPRAMIAAAAVVVIVTGILFWRLSGPPATVRVETIDFHGSSQMVALASPVGCWQEYELFHGSFSESNVPATLEQQSGLGAQLAMALGFVLLIFGCVAEWRARRAAAEHDVPVRIPDHLPRMSRLAVAAAVWAPFAVVVLALFLTKHDDTPQAIAVEVRREQPAVIRDTKLDEAKRGPDVETPPKRSAGQVSRPQPGAETRTPAATDGNVVIAAPQSRPDSTTHGPAWWQWLLIFTVLPVGIAAPFGTTILGGIALTQIRHSAGRLYGLGLALADTLLFPILLIDLVIFYFAAMIDNLALIVAVDSLLIYWGWRIANAPVPSKPLTDTGY